MAVRLILLYIYTPFPFYIFLSFSSEGNRYMVGYVRYISLRWQPVEWKESVNCIVEYWKRNLYYSVFLFTTVLRSAEISAVNYLYFLEMVKSGDFSSYIYCKEKSRQQDIYEDCYFHLFLLVYFLLMVQSWQKCPRTRSPCSSHDKHVEKGRPQSEVVE